MNIIDTIKPSKLKNITIKNLNKDEVLFRENDKCECIGIVMQGQVSIITYLEDGKEVVFNTLNTGDIFGNNLIFSSEPYYKGNIITNVSSKIALIDKKELLSLLKSNEEFMIEYFKIQSNFSKDLNDKIKLLSMDSAEDRFYYYMHKNKKTITYSSISKLAKELYIKRETLSRLISKLLKQKKIIKDKNTITLL